MPPSLCHLLLSTFSLILFTDNIIYSTKLSTTEVGNHFFAVSTLLTQATPNSKKGLRRKGEDKEDKEERKAQSKSKYTLAI
ncbi:hypothetical protein K435DRAFT_218062 [Dendrothele bispora CBS 962.96]|uniref:Secreted protein n=1 Tax=Dendrothele bispora (strain CBS 962.96) TaxID=1314807 RepID=A0A4S8LRC3_DENBC|nr:hypothetical protein K435DRAFT_218062 [Dendrothele bispora CBS 962.96]